MRVLNTAFTGEHLAAFLELLVGQPYWYGTCLDKATTALLRAKEKQYPAHYTKARARRYLKDIENGLICADCVGCVKGYAWTRGGEGVLESIGTPRAPSPDYASNGCPDVTADGMFAFAKQSRAPWGRVQTLPRIPGVALYKRGHMGVYAGDGRIVEWPGFEQGGIISRVESRDFTHWFMLPFISYSGI